jgi:hypothetical protein
MLGLVLRASDAGEGDENGDENEQTKQVAHVLFLLAFTRTDAGGLRGFEWRGALCRSRPLRT